MRRLQDKAANGVHTMRLSKRRITTQAILRWVITSTIHSRGDIQRLSTQTRQLLLRNQAAKRFRIPNLKCD